MILIMIIAIVMAGSVSAQVNCINEYVDCADVLESETDTVQLVFDYSAPGDTVWLVVHFRVPNDTILSFVTLIRYDDTYLSPVFLPPSPSVPDDTLWVAVEALGSLAQILDDNPTSTMFWSTVSFNPFDSGAIKTAFLPWAEDELPSMELVDEPLFGLPFVVVGAAPSRETARFWFHEGNEHILIDSAAQEYFCVDCRRTNLALGNLGSIPVFPTLVDNCCMCDRRGNVDMDPNDAITISDLIGMVERMFQGGPELPCPEEADINGSGSEEPDIVDLIHLVSYMFQNGPPPAPCP
jgi:hypothetical protein